MRILFPDNVHFHERNFKSLFDCIRINNYEAVFNDERIDWMTQFGNYKNKKSELRKEINWLSTLSLDELFQLEYKGVDVFQVAKSEILSLLVCLPDWDQIDIPGNDSKALLNLIHERAYEILILNCAAAINWLDFWAEKLRKIPHCSHCCIFSGSLIYSSTLVNLLKTRDTKVFILETFFTGNEYYFEERYQPIANNSKLGIDNYYDSISICYGSNDDNASDRERIQAFNKYLNRNNKNVKQPDNRSESINFNNGHKTVLIIGQVANDFSILETKLPNLNVVNTYWELVQKILVGTEYNIVFKGHPWERNKVSGENALTISRLKRRCDQHLQPGELERVKFVDDYNIDSLFNDSAYAIALCSQSLIEAACHGLKPIEFGNAFYGRKGFTFDASSVADVIGILQDPEASGTLSIPEYNQLETFLIKALTRHLVSNDDAGAKRIKELLTHPGAPRLLSKDRKKAGLSVDKVPAKPLTPLQRKWRKFKRNPYKFFKDVKFGPARMIKFLFLPYKYLK